jgi:outer membrane autotransporter protein
MKRSPLPLVALTTLFYFGPLKADPYWTIQAFGGIGNLDAENIYLDFTTYEQDKAMQTNEGDWGAWTAQLGLGYSYPLNESERFSVNPQVNAYYLQGSLEGEVDRFYQYPGDCEDTQFDSTFKSTRLMLDLVLRLGLGHQFSAFVIGGIGPSWNQIHYSQNETESYSGFEMDPEISFNFAFEAGAGLSYDLTERIRISAEYLYVGFTDITLEESGIGESDPFNMNSQTALLGFQVMI